jgi:uncharacterized protein (TIGR02646 family)
MINRLQNPFIFSSEQKDCIELALNDWNSQRNCITQLKSIMHIYFDTHQNQKCCYCGLLYDRTGRGEIDHIAPKGTGHYPEFSFSANNLVKACQLCNSSTMKHVYNSIESYSDYYNDCDFKIVHPYLDDHNDHYRWDYGIMNITISINNNSEKAKESIRIFELDSEKRTKARAQQKNQERIEAAFNITVNIKNRIKAILKFR